jgi:hypothetical protein
MDRHGGRDLATSGDRLGPVRGDGVPGGVCGPCRIPVAGSRRLRSRRARRCRSVPCLGCRAADAVASTGFRDDARSRSRGTRTLILGAGYAHRPTPPRSGGLACRRCDADGLAPPPHLAPGRCRSARSRASSDHLRSSRCVVRDFPRQPCSRPSSRLRSCSASGGRTKRAESAARGPRDSGSGGANRTSERSRGTSADNVSRGRRSTASLPSVASGPRSLGRVPSGFVSCSASPAWDSSSGAPMF